MTWPMQRGIFASSTIPPREDNSLENPNDSPKILSKAQKKRQEVAKQLQEHGIRLIAEKGLAACKVEHITKAVGVGKGTFFTHFTSKDNFVALLVDRILGDVARRVRPVALAPTDAVSLLAGVGSVHLRYFQLRPDAASVLVQACSLESGNPAAAAISGRLREHNTMLAEMLAPAALAMGWPPDRVDELALMVLSTSCGFFWFGSAMGLGQDTPMDLMERLGRALAGGLSQT